MNLYYFNFSKDFSDKENVNFFLFSRYYKDIYKGFVVIKYFMNMIQMTMNNFKNFLKKNNLSVEKKLNLIFNFISFIKVLVLKKKLNLKKNQKLLTLYYLKT